MKKVAIVTGSASGLGLESCKVLLSNGFKVIGWDLDITSLSSSDFFSKVVDVTQTTSINQALQEVISKFSKVDVLVNVAGVGMGLPTILDEFIHPLPEFENIIKTNLISTFDVSRQVSAFMENGLILLVSSINAWQGTRFLTAYSASKAAILAMTMPMARDLAGKKVRVVCISPGPFDTPMTANSIEERKIGILKSNCFARFGRPEEFAHAVLFAVKNEYLNGCDLQINGGMINPNL
jgi:NAD(P)-dependent dehydrogenase (short-subunit alcohol dehydrogenase family)